MPTKKKINPVIEIISSAIQGGVIGYLTGLSFVGAIALVIWLVKQLLA